jgi:hypothetical protein
VALVLKWGVFKDMRFENLDAAPTRGKEVDVKVQNWGIYVAGLEYDCSVEGMLVDGGVANVVGFVAGGGC